MLVGVGRMVDTLPAVTSLQFLAVDLLHIQGVTIGTVLLPDLSCLGFQHTLAGAPSTAGAALTSLSVLIDAIRYDLNRFRIGCSLKVDVVLRPTIGGGVHVGFLAESRLGHSVLTPHGRKSDDAHEFRWFG
jgi:hypothetical protein